VRGLTTFSFVKTFDLAAVSEIGISGADVYANERRHLELLQGKDLVPEIVSIEESADKAEIRLIHHPPLLVWLCDHPERLRSIGSAIHSQLRRLHQEGVCHCDVHEHNLLVDRSEMPLFIDFELAQPVSPSAPCYDLFGPPSGVPVPEAHTRVGLTDGVWWDSTPPTGFGLSAAFGLLADIDT
jgi:serine/threonine protein kinase